VVSKYLDSNITPLFPPQGVILLFEWKNNYMINCKFKKGNRPYSRRVRDDIELFEKYLKNQLGLPSYEIWKKIKD